MHQRPARNFILVGEPDIFFPPQVIEDAIEHADCRRTPAYLAPAWPLLHCRSVGKEREAVPGEGRGVQPEVLERTAREHPIVT